MIDSPISLVEIYFEPSLMSLVFKSIFKTFETRSEEHTSELQSRTNLVCRLLLEKKKKKKLKTKQKKTKH